MGYDRAIANWGILLTALMQPMFSEKALIWLDISYFPSVYFSFLLTTFVHDGYFVSEIKLRLSSTLEFPQAYSCDVCPPT